MRAESNQDVTRALRLFPSAFGQILAALTAANVHATFCEKRRIGPRVLALGVFMEDEHVIRGPQTAGEGRRVTVLVSYISLANYMSRRAAV